RNQHDAVEAMETSGVVRFRSGGVRSDDCARKTDPVAVGERVLLLDLISPAWYRAPINGGAAITQRGDGQRAQNRAVVLWIGSCFELGQVAQSVSIEIARTVA